MTISIIIPYYNVKPYTDELLNCLAPQITEDTEVILIDDGSKETYKTDYPWCKVYRQDNGGVSKARNAGLEKAKGEYICFIDSDDLVAKDYISQIKAKMPFDVAEMSWKSLPGGNQYSYKLNNPTDRLSNPSSVTRAFRRETIGNIRFNEKKQAAEDAEFVREIYKNVQKVAVITDFMYFYRTYTPNSLTKRYMTDETDTKRIIYHYNHITADMTDLLAEIKQENETNEVYVLTNQNDIPELANYAKIMTPQKVRGMELRGEPTPLFSKILPTPFFDVCIYTSQTAINGITTWINAFCHQLSERYSIAVLHDGLPSEIIERLSSGAYVKRCDEPIKCKTLLMMRIADSIPQNIHYEKSVQMVHSAKTNPEWKLPSDRDEIVPVSEAVKKSWGLKHEAILNMTYTDLNPAALRFVSATRLNTPEKGLERMKAFVKLLNEANIPYQWEIFTDSDPNIPGTIYKPMTVDIRREITKADYLVQLSDEEGFCYSIVEALEEGTAVITTPLSVLPEIGFKDGIHGYIFGFDLSGDIQRIMNVPKFEYYYNNLTIRGQWARLLGKPKDENAHRVKIKITKPFRDMSIGRMVTEGEIWIINTRRAEEIINAGYATQMGGN